MSFASLCVFTYTHPVSFLSKCHRKEPQRSSCGSNILPQRSSCAFIMQLQRSSCGFQNSSSSYPQWAARRTSSCGRKKKFLRVHYFWAVLYFEDWPFQKKIDTFVCETKVQGVILAKTSQNTKFCHKWAMSRSCPQFPLSMYGTPGTMTPLLARKQLHFLTWSFPRKRK